MKKLIAGIVVLGLLGLLGWAIYGRLQEQKKPAGGGNGGPGGPGARGGPGGRGRGGPLAVDIAPVRKATVRDVGLFTGTLVPRSLVVIAPKIQGRLETLTVDIGDKVKGGAEIASLDAGEYDQQVDQAAADLAVAEASVAECQSSLDLSNGELDRVTKLHEKKMASDSELDEARARRAACDAKLKVARAQITRCQAALSAARVRKSYTTISVPPRDDGISWVVAERFVDKGALLRANDPIVSVLDSTVVTAVIDVIERDYPKIEVGQASSVDTDAYPERQFAGRIVRVAPIMRESSRQARAEVEIPNAEGLLKPGMFVRVSIEFQRHESATVIPVSAVVRREGKTGVFMIDVEPGKEPKASFKAVETGIAEGDVIEVRSPPLDGDVVTMGQHLLQDGAPILLPEAQSDVGKDNRKQPPGADDAAPDGPRDGKADRGKAGRP